MHRALPAAIAALLLAVPAGAVTVKSETKTYSSADLRRVEVKFPVGELQVEPTDGDEVEVDITVHCRSRDLETCVQRAKRVSLRTHRAAGTLELEVAGFPRMSSRGFWIKARVRMPRHLDLDVNMRVGELDVRGVRGHMDLDLSIGEISVVAPQSSVKSVSTRGFIGESKIQVGSEHRSNVGVFGYRTRWEDGTGRSAVKARVTIGEIQVRLN